MTFNPSELRDQDGKWTKGGGSPQPPIEPVTPPPADLVLTPEFVRERANAIAKDMGFDPTRIDISEEQPTFVLNGKTYTTGGLADTHLPEGTGRVTLFRKSLDKFQLDGIIVHEIEHMKFQTVLNRYVDESTAIGKDPGPLPNPAADHYYDRRGGSFAVMSADGSLRGIYKQRYPTYTAVQEALYQHGTDEFAKTDGVSPYSYDWWVAYQDGKASSAQAFHETLAEMARIKRMTGTFPEHMGPRMMEYRAKLNRELISKPDFDGYVPAPSKAEIAKGTKMWRELYRTVDRLTK